MENWAEIWVYEKNTGVLGRVHDAEGTLEPELWVVEHGVKKFPEAIYFFKHLSEED